MLTIIFNYNSINLIDNNLSKTDIQPICLNCQLKKRKRICCRWSMTFIHTVLVFIKIKLVEAFISD